MPIQRYSSSDGISPDVILSEMIGYWSIELDSWDSPKDCEDFQDNGFDPYWLKIEVRDNRVFGIFYFEPLAGCLMLEDKIRVDDWKGTRYRFQWHGRLLGEEIDEWRSDFITPGSIWFPTIDCIEGHFDIFTYGLTHFVATRMKGAPKCSESFEKDYGPGRMFPQFAE